MGQPPFSRADRSLPALPDVSSMEKEAVFMRIVVLKSPKVLRKFLQKMFHMEEKT